MAKLTVADLDRLEALRKAATAGAWTISKVHDSTVLCEAAWVVVADCRYPSTAFLAGYYIVFDRGAAANAAFIAEAANSWKALIALARKALESSHAR